MATAQTERCQAESIAPSITFGVNHCRCRAAGPLDHLVERALHPAVRYRLPRTTSDVDFSEVLPRDMIEALKRTADGDRH